MASVLIRDAMGTLVVPGEVLILNNVQCNFPTFGSRWDEDQIRWGLCREAVLEVDLGNEGSSIVSKLQISQRQLSFFSKSLSDF